MTWNNRVLDGFSLDFPFKKAFEESLFILLISPSKQKEGSSASEKLIGLKIKSEMTVSSTTGFIVCKQTSLTINIYDYEKQSLSFFQTVRRDVTLIMCLIARSVISGSRFFPWEPTARSLGSNHFSC